MGIKVFAIVDGCCFFSFSFAVIKDVVIRSQKCKILLNVYHNRVFFASFLASWTLEECCILILRSS